MRIVSWNVNGIRAAAGRGLLDFLASDAPDLLLLQETKAQPEQLGPELIAPPGYTSTFSSAEKKGYSGVVTYARRPPDEVWTQLDEPRFDREGRMVATRYADLVVYNIYFPNGQKDEVRLQYKLDFYEYVLEHFQAQRALGRSLVIAGDVNTAHKPIDLARPQANEKISGFLPIERAWMDRFVAAGYVDSFRLLYPDRTEAYSWWSLRSGARARNVGWRIDYLFVSEDLAPKVRGAAILPEVQGSDHCPVALDLAV